MILIDGNNLFARYYAQLSFMTVNNCNVGGMFGFLRNLYSFKQKFNDNILVIWDGKNGKEMRRKIYPEYKRNRTYKFDDNFIPSKEEIFNVLKDYTGIPQVRMDNCFVGYTRISVPIKGNARNGKNYSVKRVKDLNIGDDVYSFNIKTQKIEISKVTKVFTRKVNERFHINFEQLKHGVVTTANHPFFTNRGWINAEDLHLNDTIYTINDLKYFKGDWIHIGYTPSALSRKRIRTIGNGLTIRSISKITDRKKVPVYNIEVTPNNTYFANSCLVHNCEADDVIGYITNAVTKFSSTLTTEKIYIVSNDKDFWQLISDRVFILIKDRIFDLEELQKETGCVSGQEFLSCKALAGDPSDGISGVHKVGLKRALKIVREHNIHLYKDIYERNMKLMDLRNKLIEIDFIVGESNLEEYITWCMKYRFKSLVEDAEDFIKKGKV